MLDGGERFPPLTVIESFDAWAAVGNVPERKPLRPDRPVKAKAEAGQLHELGPFGIHGRCGKDPLEVLPGDAGESPGPGELILNRCGEDPIYIGDLLLGPGHADDPGRDEAQSPVTRFLHQQFLEAPPGSSAREYHEVASEISGRSVLNRVQEESRGPVKGWTIPAEEGRTGLGLSVGRWRRR
jgi:hypothetical protein